MSVKISQIRRALLQANPYLTVPGYLNDGKMSARYAVIASEQSYPDSLTASSLLGEGVLLLTDPNKLEISVQNELGKLAPEKVYIIGGEKAVSAAVERTLRENYTVERIAGANRELTAGNVFTRFVGVYPINAKRQPFFVNRGYGEGTRGFADSIALGGLAARTKTPVILTGSEAPSPVFSAVVWPHLVRSGVSDGAAQAMLVGGTSAISDTVEQKLIKEIPTWRTSRIRGSNRFATAAKLSSLSSGTKGLIIADGTLETAWQYGFALASLASVMDADVYLADSDSIPAETAEKIKSFGHRGRPIGSVMCFASEPVCLEAHKLLMASDTETPVSKRTCGTKSEATVLQEVGTELSRRDGKNYRLDVSSITSTYNPCGIFSWMVLTDGTYSQVAFFSGDKFIGTASDRSYPMAIDVVRKSDDTAEVVYSFPWEDKNITGGTFTRPSQDMQYGRVVKTITCDPDMLVLREYGQDPTVERLTQVHKAIAQSVVRPPSFNPNPVKPAPAKPAPAKPKPVKPAPVKPKPVKPAPPPALFPGAFPGAKGPRPAGAKPMKRTSVTVQGNRWSPSGFRVRYGSETISCWADAFSKSNYYVKCKSSKTFDWESSVLENDGTIEIEPDMLTWPRAIFSQVPVRAVNTSHYFRDIVCGATSAGVTCWHTKNKQGFFIDLNGSRRI